MGILQALRAHIAKTCSHMDFTNKDFTYREGNIKDINPATGMGAWYKKPKKREIKSNRTIRGKGESK